MVVAIAAGPERVEGIDPAAFTVEQGASVAAFPPIYEADVFMAVVGREVSRIRQAGGEAVRQEHEAAKMLFLGQLTDYGDARFRPKDLPTEQVVATVEQLRLHADVLSEADRLAAAA
jgi:hypothetical protein